MSSGGDARNSGKRGNVNVTCCVRDNNNKTFYYYLINITSIYLCILSLSPTCTFSKQLAQKLLHTAFKELCVAPVIVTLHFMNSYKTKIVMSFSFCC